MRQCLEDALLRGCSEDGLTNTERAYLVEWRAGAQILDRQWRECLARALWPESEDKDANPQAEVVD